MNISAIRLFRISLVLCLILEAPGPGWAQEFKILGLRALGMGGAGVAVAEGGTTQYWNPGNLAFQKRFDIEAPVSMKVEATGDILDKANQIADLGNQIASIQNIQAANSALNLTQVKDFNNAVSKITALNQDASGVLLGVQGGGNGRFGRLAVSVNNFTEVGVAPYIDTRFSLNAGGAAVSLPGSGALNDASLAAQRDQLANVISNMSTNFGVNLSGGATSTQVANNLINQAQSQGTSNSDITTAINDAKAANDKLVSEGITGSGGSFKDNQTNVTLRGASLMEYAVGYGYPLPIPERWGRLGLGGNVKLIQGKIGFKRVDLISNGSLTAGDALRDFKNNETTSVRPAVDLGAQWWTPLPWQTRLGIVAHNLNSPKFDQPAEGVAAGEGDYKEDLQARTGIAIQPLSRLTLASDIDISRNRTAIPNFESRVWGAGAEFDLWLVKLRAGMMKNLSGGTPLAYTAGVGLRVFMVALDLGASVSSKTVRFQDGTEVPASFQVGLNLGIMFGGRREASKKS